MSDARFVAMAVPDLFEIGGRVAVNTGLVGQSSQQKPRRPRIPGAFPASQPPVFGKGDPTVTTVSPSLSPEEIQRSLNGELVAYVDRRPTPESKAEALIKIGSYRVELQRYLPLLKDAALDLREEVFAEWFVGGDVELKKMVFNAVAGNEELPLHKAAPPAGPEAELAKMLDAAPDPSQRAALVQKMGVYASQLANLWDRADEMKVPEANRSEAIQGWLDDGDRSHQAMKKALADAEARRRASTEGVSHKDVVAFTAGNASSHADSKLGGSGGSGTPDSGIRRSIPSHSTEEGGGGRMPGSQAAPGQDSNERVSVDSGQNDMNGGKSNRLTVDAKINRKGTTGGLGSVAGANGGTCDTPETDDDDADGDWGHDTDRDESSASDKKRKKKPAEKAESFADGLMKYMPQAFLASLRGFTAADQGLLKEFAANHGADLLAWSKQNATSLQKRALDGAISDWLSEDPEAVEMKKFVAEALATAEAIPLELGKAIMAWEPRQPAMTKAAPAPTRRAVRQPYNTIRAA